MARRVSGDGRLPRGVRRLAVERAGRRFRAAIKHGKAGKVHLGLYPTPAWAAVAYNIAALAIGRAEVPPNPIPASEQPPVDEIRRITSRVRRRLGLEPEPDRRGDLAPDPDRLVTLFEVAVVGFWRQQASTQAEGGPAEAVDAAARRLADAAESLFWSARLGHPDPLDVLTEAVTRRFDRAFRRGDLIHEVLDDDGDDPALLARWLVFPDAFAGTRTRGFAAEVRHLYPEFFAGTAVDGPAPWASVLGVEPPFTLERIRKAYLARSLEVHPDRGGRPEDFVRLQAAYDEARRLFDPTGQD